MCSYEIISGELLTTNTKDWLCSPMKPMRFIRMNRKEIPLNREPFSSLIAIASLLGVLAFTEARAKDLYLYDFSQNPDARNKIIVASKFDL